MMLADWQIAEHCSYKNDTSSNMIHPFVSRQIKQVEGSDLEARKVISYGLSSYGYDIRLSDSDFRVFVRQPAVIVDPKDMDAHTLVSQKVNYEYDGAKYFILPAHTYALGVSMERFNMPSNVSGVCVGKSTYARVGVIVNITPLEAGWRGYLTVEVSNSSCADVRIYAGEGIAQILFLTGAQCRTTYDDRHGKYQDQRDSVTLPRM